MIFFLKLYDMLTWMCGCMSEICFFFHFSFFLYFNLRVRKTRLRG